MGRNGAKTENYVALSIFILSIKMLLNTPLYGDTITHVKTA